MSSEESYTGPNIRSGDDAKAVHRLMIELANRAGLVVVEVGTWSPAEQPEETLSDPE